MKWWQSVRVKSSAGVAAILAVVAAVAVVSDHLVSIGKAVDWAIAFVAQNKPVVKKPVVIVRDVIATRSRWVHFQGIWVAEIEAVVANDGGDADDCGGELKIIDKSIEQDTLSADSIEEGGETSDAGTVKISGGRTERRMTFKFSFTDDSDPYNKAKFRVVCDGVVTPLVDVTLDPKWAPAPSAQQPPLAVGRRAAKPR